MLRARSSKFKSTLSSTTIACQLRRNINNDDFGVVTPLDWRLYTRIYMNQPHGHGVQLITAMRSCATLAIKSYYSETASYYH